MTPNTGPRSHEPRKSAPYYGKRPASLYEVTGRIEDINTLLVPVHDGPALGNPSMNHRVTAKARKPVAVRTPVRRAVDRVTALIVEVYAFGAGVTLAAQECNLPRAEGAFELEANGQRFVIDPLGAHKANWLVAPVKRNVTAIFEPVQAEDQEQLLKLGFDLSHGVHPGVVQRTAILSLPQGVGKTTMSHSLALRLGCTHVVDDWLPDSPILPGALHLTSFDVLTEGAAA